MTGSGLRWGLRGLGLGVFLFAIFVDPLSRQTFDSPLSLWLENSLGVGTEKSLTIARFFNWLTLLATLTFVAGSAFGKPVDVLGSRGIRTLASRLEEIQKRYAGAYRFLIPLGIGSSLAWLAVMVTPPLYTPGEDSEFGLIFSAACFAVALSLPLGLWFREAAPIKK